LPDTVSQSSTLRRLRDERLFQIKESVDSRVNRERAQAMPERFDSNIFSPEANKLMREVFEAAWPKASLVEGNREATRQLLASVIIDQVVSGAEDRDQIAAAALATLAVARNVSS
jgi:hypothetical protein